MKILVTGITGYVGAALAPRLVASGHDVRGFARNASRVTVPVADVVEGDAVSGRGLDEALDGVEVAYYLIHSMERSAQAKPTASRQARPRGFDVAERRSAENFAEAAARAGVKRTVYLGGIVPTDKTISRHLGSRLAVEEALLDAVPDSLAFRASIVIAASSRSFRFLVRLIERLPVMALPAWRVHRTAPIDGRDVLAFLESAATAPETVAGRSWDIGGPDVMTYGEMIERIEDHLIVDRPALKLGFSLTPVASVVAAAVAGEDTGLIAPLMESLQSDLLPRDEDAAAAFGVRLHSFDAAVERALREWETNEEIRVR
jgi:uncharacterized protein YbjT (DUF2867 family)